LVNHQSHAEQELEIVNQHLLLLLVDQVGLVVLVKYIICQTSLHHVFASTTCSPISVSEFSSLGKMERLSDKNEGWSEWSPPSPSESVYVNVKHKLL